MTLVVQYIIGRAQIADPVRGRVYPFGPGFAPLPAHLEHRHRYSVTDAQKVADWLNGNDQPLDMIARGLDPFDPVNRRNWDAARQNGQRRGLAPLPDKE